MSGAPRSRHLRVAVAAGCTGALLLALAAPASAAVRGRIVQVQASKGILRVVFNAAGLAVNEVIDPASVRLTLDGQPLAAKVDAGAAVRTTNVERRVVLAIDTSGSMVGARIAAARQAAVAYLAKVPADVKVGLVTFSTTAVVAVPPTTDRNRVRTAVQGLTATGNTALFDAVGLAVSQLGASGDRSILLLSDGQDDGSRGTLAQDQAALKASKVALNGVLLGPDGAQQSLTALTTAAGGRVVSAQAAADLTRAFEDVAKDVDKDVVLTAVIPKRFTGGEAPVAVTATAGGQQISDTAIALNLVSNDAAASDPAAFGPKPVEPVTGLFRNSTAMWLGLLALFLGLGALLVQAVVGAGSRQPSMRRRLRPFVDQSGARRKAEPEPPRGVRETAVGLADEIVKQGGLEVRLGNKLEAAGIPLKPSEWLIVHVGIALLLPLVVLLLTNVNPALTLTAVIVGVLGPLGYLAFKATARTRAFLTQLPDTLQLLAGSLSAGYSLPQALDAVVRQGSPPMADELRKALVEARLGAPMEDALDDVADRMGSKDFRWVVMAIRVQRQVGGNLAEVLGTTAATLRERERLRRQVQVLSAEGRLSAYILFGLPIVFALYLLAVRPDYLRPLYTDPIGIFMLVGMAILLTVGGLWLRKVVKVEV
jgi:tight adherence protein B